MTTDLAQAREYLARVLPWPQEGDEPAFVDICWTWVPDNLEPGRKPPWTGRAVRSVKEATKVIEWALSKPDTRDIYVCLSTQRLAEEKTSQTGWKYYTPIRNQENAVRLKTLWLDIDAYKPNSEKGYGTMEEAVAALDNFLKATSLPRPTMFVASGGGLHVYWTMDRALTPEEWLRLAYALVEATQREGLKCDREISADSARVLRIPNTLNRKTDPPREVRLAGPRQDFDYLVERIEKALEPYKVPVPTFTPHGVNGFIIDPSLFPPKPPVTGDDDLSAGIVTAMSQEEVRACLAVIPNTKVDWIWWNTIGMRVYAACDGADYGLSEWKAWSLTNPNAAANATDSCEDRWNTYHTSPPTRTGAGALINEARTATGNPQWLPTAVTALPAAASTASVTPGQRASVTSRGYHGFGPVVSPTAGLEVKFSNIPHRRWLYGVDLVRGEISLLAAPGGVGKSSLAIGMSVAIVTNREVFEERIFGGGNLRTLYVNAEDSRTEMLRRTYAFCLKHGIAEQDLVSFLWPARTTGVFIGFHFCAPRRAIRFLMRTASLISKRSSTTFAPTC
jgi:AAA domain/Primase C terminal 2 (PriCT-2)